eukprot:3017503-Amphidinium_carterae.1
MKKITHAIPKVQSGQQVVTLYGLSSRQALRQEQKQSWCWAKSSHIERDRKEPYELEPGGWGNESHDEAAATHLARVR